MKSSSLEAQLERLRAVLPEEQDVADLLRRVQAMATQSNLAILGFAPKAVAKKQLHAEWPIGLKLEGTYHDLGSFLERVSKFPRIINVGDIKIDARTNQSDGSTVTAECTATTFVLLDEAAASCQAGQAGAAAPAAPKKRSDTAMRTLSLIVIGLSFVATLAHAQAAPPASPAPAPAAPAAAAQRAADHGGEGRSAVEPQGFTYNPEGRRDPFVSLLRRGTDARANAGPKAAGLGGLGTSEVSLRGTSPARAPSSGSSRASIRRTTSCASATSCPTARSDQSQRTRW